MTLQKVYWFAHNLSMFGKTGYVFFKYHSQIIFETSLDEVSQVSNNLVECKSTGSGSELVNNILL